MRIMVFVAAGLMLSATLAATQDRSPASSAAPGASDLADHRYDYLDSWMGRDRAAGRSI